MFFYNLKCFQTSSVKPVIVDLKITTNKKNVKTKKIEKNNMKVCRFLF